MIAEWLNNLPHKQILRPTRADEIENSPCSISHLPKKRKYKKKPSMFVYVFLDYFHFLFLLQAPIIEQIDNF